MYSVMRVSNNRTGRIKERLTPRHGISAYVAPHGKKTRNKRTLLHGVSAYAASQGRAGKTNKEMKEMKLKLTET